jgi:hypothetical protein
MTVQIKKGLGQNMISGNRYQKLGFKYYAMKFILQFFFIIQNEMRKKADKIL